MTRQDIIDHAVAFIASSPLNTVGPDTALTPDVAGLRLFDAPLVAFGAADDPLFDKLREPQVVGPMFRPPGDWLDGARTVISVFMPFSATVRESNRADPRAPSAGWLHARIEGQALLGELCCELIRRLNEQGHGAVAPSLDPHFTTENYRSSWSERHVGFVCGLGTFGLSAGLITERGMAGRLGSVVTTLALPPDTRPYTDVYEYCTRCGACLRACPVHAIGEDGKKHPPCDALLEETRAAHAPYYGCGKCQVGVPCEASRPARRAE